MELIFLHACMFWIWWLLSPLNHFGCPVLQTSQDCFVMPIYFTVWSLRWFSLSGWSVSIYLPMNVTSWGRRWIRHTSVVVFFFLVPSFLFPLPIYTFWRPFPGHPTYTDRKLCFIRYVILNPATRCQYTFHKYSKDN